MEGVGGVVINPNGTRETIAWGLRYATNNQDELWDLRIGLWVLFQQNIRHGLVFGDSQLVNKKYLKMNNAPTHSHPL